MADQTTTNDMQAHNSPQLYFREVEQLIHHVSIPEPKAEKKDETERLPREAN